MSYLENLEEGIINEYKSGNPEKRVFLQTLKAALQKKKIDLREGYNEEVELATLKNELKQLNESLKEQKEAGRDDLSEATLKQIKILESILPEQMPYEEIEKKVKEIVATLDDKSFGNVMKQAMDKLRSSADGGKISGIVRKILEENA